jgi:N6-L-threonylcarbamoyladenine synthase
MATILGIESTCDETAAAVVVDGFEVRSNVVASQIELHRKYRGVVPEIASRAHIENILPVIREAILPPLPPGEGRGESIVVQASKPAFLPPLPSGEGRGEGELQKTSNESRLTTSLTPTLSRGERGKKLDLSQIDAVAVAHRPGLIGSLLIGVTAAKALAWALGKPLIGIDHVHAHLYSVVLGNNLHPPMPAVGLVCSGGHTALYEVRDWMDVSLIGSTIDDAVGEAYDKVSAILNLGYPGGPVIDRLAEKGDPRTIRFPRTLLDRDSLDFSFSGLKTAVLYRVRGVPRRGDDVKSEPTPALGESEVADICAGFQAACVDVLLEKVRRAARRIDARSVIIGGGVSANRGLRAAAARFPLPVFFPPVRYCTDNAAMSAGLAQVYFDKKIFSDLSLDAVTFSRLTAT